LNRPRRAALSLACSIVLIGTLAGACEGDDVSLEVDTATPATAGPDARPAMMSFSDGQFQPDYFEMQRGGTLVVSNETDATVTVVLSGTGFTEPESREIEAGGSFQVQLDVPGAQVLTVAGDVEATGSVMVVGADGGQG
jgi:hypothetical protein